MMRQFFSTLNIFKAVGSSDGAKSKKERLSELPTKQSRKRKGCRNFRRDEMKSDKAVGSPDEAK